MPFRELKGKNERAFYDIRVQQLTSLYRDSQRRLLKIVNSADSTDFQAARAQMLLAQVKEEIRRLDVYSRKWVMRNVPEAYDRGLEFAGERLRALNIARKVDSSAQVHRTAVNVIADQMTLDLLQANASAERQVTQYLRKTQQKFLEERAINRNIGQGIIEGESRRTTSDRLYQDLKAKMGDEQFISIRGRNYQPDSYARLVARTRTREATTKGTINTTLQYGLDLVQISVSSNACEMCLKFQGKVYSLSGTSKDFPPLKEEPPFHPNCEHVLLPATQEGLEATGAFDELKRFSKSTDQVEDFAQFEELIAA